MDMDILTRKSQSRGYSFPKGTGHSIYKQFFIKSTLFTIESSSLSDKKSSHLHIYKLENGSEEDVLVADILCKNLAEVDSACNNIEKFIEGEPSSPFDCIISDTNMGFKFKKNGWISTKSK